MAHSLFLVAKSFSACRSLEPSLTNWPLWSRDSRYRRGNTKLVANVLQGKKRQYDNRKLHDEHEPSLNSWGAHPDVVLGYHIFACSRSANIIKLFRVHQPFAVPALTSRRAVCLSHCERMALQIVTKQPFVQKQDQTKHLPHYPLPSESISLPCDTFNFTKVYLKKLQVPSCWHKSPFFLPKKSSSTCNAVSV